MANVASVFKLGGGSSLLNTPSNRLITEDMVGIEIELEGLLSSPLRYREGHLSRWWDCVEDGSLRRVDGHNSGEFVFNEPMFGKDVVNALEALENEVTTYALTDRTSVHVHLDVRDMSFNSLLRLLCTYLLVEPFYFAMVKEGRDNNPYCSPLRSCLPYLRAVARCLIEEKESTYTSLLAHLGGSKYTALNFLPMATQGSIEFRHKEGAISSEDIINWVNMVLCLKRYAVSTEERITAEEIDAIVDNYGYFVKDLFEGVEGIPFDSLTPVFRERAGVCAKTLLSSEKAVPSYDTYEEGAENGLFWEAVSKRFYNTFYPKTKKGKSRVPEPPPPTFTASRTGGERVLSDAWINPPQNALPVGGDALRRAREGLNQMHRQRDRAEDYQLDTERDFSSTFNNIIIDDES